jgi:subtilase family serine protease
MSCLAYRRTDVRHAKGVAAATPSGYSPADLASAYALPSGTAGAGETVAITIAYDNPHLESDLAVYREQYGLPPCTTANGCLRKIDQRGGTDYPIPDEQWGGELDLDVDMVSAACSLCHLLVVEADDNSEANLFA